MTCYAAVAITAPGTISLDGFDSLVELIRETAYPMPGGRTILIQWEAANYWDLRGVVQSTFEAIESFDFYIDLPDLDNPGDGSDTNLARMQTWVGIKPDLRLPFRDIGYTAVECERDMRRLTNGERGCANPDEHEGERNKFLHMQENA